MRLGGPNVEPDFNHPGLPRPKKEPHGKLTTSTGAVILWRWYTGSLEMVCDQEFDFLEAWGLLPKFVTQLHETFWDKFVEIYGKVQR
jgi:hypothetical protein